MPPDPFVQFIAYFNVVEVICVKTKGIGKALALNEFSVCIKCQKMLF